MKIVLAILTSLMLLGSQLGVLSLPAVAAACCGNCAGQCCVKDSTAPPAAEPLAPAPANTASNLDFLFVAASLRTALPAADVSSSSPLPPEPAFASTRPIFQQYCVYLI